MDVFMLVGGIFAGLIATTLAISLTTRRLRNTFLGKLSPERISDPSLRRAAWQHALVNVLHFVGYALYFTSFWVRERVAPVWQEWVSAGGTLCLILGVGASWIALRLQQKLNREVLGVAPPAVFGTYRSHLLVVAAVMGAVLGPLLGIVIARSFGLSGETTFVLALFLGLVTFVPLLVYVVRMGQRAQKESKQHGGRASPDEVGTYRSNRHVLAVACVGLAVVLITGVVVFVLLRRGS